MAKVLKVGVAGDHTLAGAAAGASRPVLGRARAPMRAQVGLLYNTARIWRGNSFDQLTNGFFTLILAWPYSFVIR
ncbi:hypothetical protein NHH88_03790 [Oxalobacteraceae bacterium OTU3CAMAD1]|nr:hypothetical protein NHH88_03790 [Oxalobacteraceae bacterium OTU3CAMAD1]